MVLDAQFYPTLEPREEDFCAFKTSLVYTVRLWEVGEITPFRHPFDLKTLELLINIKPLRL